MERGLVGQACERVEVAGLDLLLLTRCLQTVVRVLADRLQHGVARAAMLLIREYERRINQPQQTEGDVLSRQLRVGAYHFGNVQRPTAGKNRQSSQQDLLNGCEQGVAPVDRRPERLVPLWRGTA